MTIKARYQGWKHCTDVLACLDDPHCLPNASYMLKPQRIPGIHSDVSESAGRLGCTKEPVTVRQGLANVRLNDVIAGFSAEVWNRMQILAHNHKTHPFPMNHTEVQYEQCYGKIPEQVQYLSIMLLGKVRSATLDLVPHALHVGEVAGTVTLLGEQQHSGLCLLDLPCPEHPLGCLTVDVPAPSHKCSER